MGKGVWSGMWVRECEVSVECMGRGRGVWIGIYSRFLDSLALKGHSTTGSDVHKEG